MSPGIFVIEQILGETANEKFTFNYSVANEVTEINRNGFQKVIVFNAAGNMTQMKEYTNLNLRSVSRTYLLPFIPITAIPC